MASLKQRVLPVYHAGLRVLPDRLALGVEVVRELRYWPNFAQPERFTEKLQVMKLGSRDPRYGPLCHKVAVKEIVASTLGEEWVIPTIWRGTRLPLRADRDLDWPVPFVVKASSGSARHVVVRSDAEKDWPAIEWLAHHWLTTPYGRAYREHQYGLIPPMILVEPFIGALGHYPLDFKLFVFQGRVEFIEVDTDRETAHKRCFYDREWVKQPFTIQYPMEPKDIPRPVSLDAMIHAAETLAAGFPFLRVDFYEVDGRPLFGEITVFPDSGYGRVTPDEYDVVLGRLLP